MNPKIKKVLSKISFQRGVQVYLGIFLIMNAGVGWITPLAELKLPSEAENFIASLWQINLLMPTVKGIELVAGLLFLFNRYNFLALLIFYPVLLNIIFVGIHFFGSITYSLPMICSVLFLSYKNREKYSALLHI